MHRADLGANERNYNGRYNRTLRSCADLDENINVKRCQVSCWLLVWTFDYCENSYN